MMDSQPKLPRAQVEALRAISLYRRQRRLGGKWLVGDHGISLSTIAKLENEKLVQETSVEGAPFLIVTPQGKDLLK